MRVAGLTHTGRDVISAVREVRGLPLLIFTCCVLCGAHLRPLPSRIRGSRLSRAAWSALERWSWTGRWQV
eukprot:3082772-Prymnesium_polylepis.1